MTFEVFRKRRVLRERESAFERRDDIQGLRTLAALLVAAYHIWTHRVSGAVDVFFVVSAFVMTQSLLREIERSGTVSLPRFYRNLLFRMAPLAWAVIAGTMLAALLLLPVTQWSTIGEQATSAALFQINYFLGFESIAYLGEAANSSLFQHFWAMSVQVQFYLVFPLLGWLIAAAIRTMRVPRTPLLFCVFSVVLAASLAYATASVVENQAFAYFDTGARVWEFAAGALVAIALPHLRLPRSAGVILAATGLAVLVSFGAFLDATTLFPGPAALVPVVAAIAILVGGVAGTTHGASKLLASRPLVAAAEYSFGFYLWHWPVLVMHRQLTGQELLGPVDGLGVIAISGALAYLTHRLIEGPVRGAARKAKTSRDWRKPIVRLAVLALIPLLAVGGTRAYVDWLLASNPVDNPGAAVLTGPVALSPFAEVQPPLATLENGQWEEWGQECTQRRTENGAEFRECNAGFPSAPLNVVALGDSHTENWLTAFAPAIESGAVRLTSWFRGACPLSTVGSDKLGADHADTPDCEAVNLERIALAIDENPDVVFTTGNIAEAGSPELRFTDGFVEAAEQLSQAGLPIVAMRDIPRHSDRSSVCLEEHEMDEAACSVPAEELLEELDFNASLPETLWQNPMVTGIDLTRLICFDGMCPPVIGGILTYIDDNHLTRAYIETMSPSFMEEFKGALQAVGQPIPPALTTF